MTIEEKIAVLQAAKEGKPIQVRAIGHSLEWTAPLQVNELSWDFSRLEYRVKPEPREWWLVINSLGIMPYSDEESASFAAKNWKGGKIVRVREVLE